MLLVSAEWFFAHHVTAELHGADNISHVCRVYSGDGYGVGPRLFDHQVEIGESGRGHPDQFLCGFNPFAFVVAQADDLYDVAVVLYDLPSPRERTARSRADDCHA